MNSDNGSRQSAAVLDVMVLSQAAFQHARAGEAMHLDWLISLGLPVDLSTERDMLKLLLERGTETERSDASGRTALDYARSMGAQGTAQRLSELRSKP